MSLPLNPFALELRKGGIITFLIFLLMIFALVAWLLWSRGEWKSEATAYQAEIEQYKTANQSWSDKAIVANAALEKVEAEAKIRAGIAARAIDAARKSASSSATRAAALMAMPASANECADIFSFIDNYYEAKP